MKVIEEYLTDRKHQKVKLASPSFISQSSSAKDLRAVRIVLDDEKDLDLTGGFIDFVTSRYSDFRRVFLTTKKGFVRAFYTKPVHRIATTLRAKPCCKSHQRRKAGCWFDVLLKWYILLNTALGFEPDDIRRFLEGFYQTPYDVRWKLDHPTFEGDPRKCQQLAKLPGPELHSVHDSWDVFLDYFDNMAPSSLCVRENEIVYSKELGFGWKRDSHLLTSEMVTDLLHLIDCVDHTDLTYDDLFVYRMHLLGSPIDFLLDDLLVDAKVTISSTLKWSYFDQLVSYYIRFYLLKRHYAISDVDIQYVGIYFARHGYLYKLPVDQIVDIERLDKFACG